MGLQIIFNNIFSTDWLSIPIIHKRKGCLQLKNLAIMKIQTTFEMSRNKKKCIFKRLELILDLK